MEYNKLFNVALKGMEKNRVKFGSYDNQKAIIIDGCYLILVPESDFMLDVEKCLNKTKQVTLIDCGRMLSGKEEAEQYQLTDTHFKVKIEKIEYHIYKYGEESVYFREEALSYLSKWEDIQICKAPGRANPGFLYVAGNITRFIGIVMPFYHNKTV